MIHEIKLPERRIRLKGKQCDYFNCIKNNTLTFAIGPAGTGKTFLAVASALDSLIKGEVARVVLVRPAVEAGEKLGYIPGSIFEKVDPYMRPLHDSLHECLGDEKKFDSKIEIAPLAFMRGRTFRDSFIICDEAQNATPKQLLMFMTRLGYGSKMVVVGDTTQVDLENQSSGLTDAVKRLSNIEDVGIVELTKDEIRRHPLVEKVINAYTKKFKGYS